MKKMNINHNITKITQKPKYHRPNLSVVLGGKYQKEKNKKHTLKKIIIISLLVLFNYLISLIMFFYVKIILKF